MKMSDPRRVAGNMQNRSRVFSLVLSLWACVPLSQPATAAEPASLAGQLKGSPYKIAYESYANDNWDIFVSNADGSNPVNLTSTPKVHEHYPQVSPDASKICFSVDEGEGREAVRSLWVMDIDGSHRRKLTDHAREPFWRHDGKVIGFLPQEYPKFNVMDFYTKGMSFFDLTTGEITPHVNTTNLFHLYNPGFSADDKWIVSTVHAGMGMDHAIILIEANGTNIINLDIPGCRPCFSPDGKKLAWGAGDHEIALAPIDLSAARPSIGKWSLTVTHPTNDTYHVDWSPDSRFVSISTGPATRGDATKPGTFMAACEIVGVFAPGWNIVVVPADRTGTLELDKLTDADLVRVTTNGFSNKESAWFVAKPQKEKAK